MTPLRVLLCLAGIWLAACGTPETLPPQVSAARVVMPPPGASMAAGYFELRNPGRGALELLGVSSSAFAVVEMHQTTDVNGIARMRAIDRVTVPAGETVRFEPGGAHLMLSGARVGSAKTAELPFTLDVKGEDGRRIKVEAGFVVTGATAPADRAGSEHAAHDHGHR